MKTYVLHYTPLLDRRMHVDTQLRNNNINGIFIETEEGPGTYMNLQKGSVSLIKKHIQAWTLIANDPDPYGLIFEDDVILDTNFSSKLEGYLAQLPLDFDMLFIGNGLSDNYHIDIPPGTIGIRTPYTSNPPYNGITRCTDSYVLSKACASRMLQYAHDNALIYYPIDHWMNKMALDMKFSKVFWAEPTIVSQGSELGLFSSCILR